MHDRRKSDRSVLPAKPPNNTANAVAEVVEGRDLAEGNTTSKTRPGHRAGLSALSALDRVRRIAAGDKDARFTALLHHVDVDRLRAAYWALKPKAAAGVDGVTWRTTDRTSKRTFGICTPGSIVGATGRGRHGGRTYRRRTGGFDRSGSRRLRTRSSSGRPSRCRTRSTRRTSSVSRTGFGRGAARIMRWMRSPPGSSGGR
jgi:hypothetical protein